MEQTACHDEQDEMNDMTVTTLKPRDIGKALKLTQQVIAHPKLASLVVALTVACQSQPQQSPEKALMALLKGGEHESLL
ncbi:hypothetical protein CGH72_16905 [Vibrio parahaemolyticus]|uniref:hypothetical protein n=1 Tax=Vibrio parahaemolyticus TaxID=670 RepID=UPI0011237046|nr:hypothetical protein [Vibrio parahaemolyticus]TOM63457.1 hypothetical protein CGH75_02865 [Vibrio parahaemolyticus]TOM64358.1 hypothetical protein CGH73_22205 [Vibrio parahaemolyticus]TOM69248.1 hypothetical protein CGH72_16905 [Vibrio parahaemolyticus]TOM98475.1 hypothetical protein CGH67_25235 [Vibrio parahaemolyticus]TOO77186.1 hypothetical protein CGH29_26095 [Vibrio parahaemolyticus]